MWIYSLLKILIKLNSQGTNNNLQNIPPDLSNAVHTSSDIHQVLSSS